MQSEPSDTSPSLLERARAHDQQAWARLVRIYGPLVYGWARATGVQPSDASDVVQEVFAAVSTHLHSFRREGKGDSFRGWLWTICRNKVRDLIRQRQAYPEAVGGTTAAMRLREIPDLPPAEEPSDPQTAAGEFRQRALLEFRQGFEERVWKAFWSVVVEERPPAEVAAELGVSVWAVYKAKARVAHRLRQELEGLLDLA